VHESREWGARTLAPMRAEAPGRRPPHSADGECGETGGGGSVGRPRCTGRLGNGQARGRERGQTCVHVQVRIGRGGRGESPGVERRELDCGRGVGEEFVARSVEVDVERKLLDPLGYGECKDSNRDAGVGLLVETGGIKGRSSLAGRDVLRSGAGDSCSCLCGAGASGVYPWESCLEYLVYALGRWVWYPMGK
jgi:hypothetical protein